MKPLGPKDSDFLDLSGHIPVPPDQVIGSVERLPIPMNPQDNFYYEQLLKNAKEAAKKLTEIHQQITQAKAAGTNPPGIVREYFIIENRNEAQTLLLLELCEKISTR